MADKGYLYFFTMISLRYFIFAGLAFLVFYVLFRPNFIHRKIQKLFPTKKDYLREISYSASTLFIFAFIAVALRSPIIKPHTQLYANISDHSWWYFGLSVVLALIIHDTYFYWTHRLMHHPRLFKIFHLVHHHSTNPSPWAAYAFHPLEAVVEGGVIFVIAFLIPIHFLAIALFMIIMIAYNVYGHLGYEIYPLWLVKSPLGRWLNTSTNHNMHHKFFKGNYGLYFRFWDEILKTTHPNYEQTIKNVVSSQK